MATLTIRNVDDATRRRIQLRAARNGRSMEAEVREALSGLYGQASFGDALLTATRRFRDDVGGVELELPPRSTPRVPDLSDGQR